MTLKVEIDWKGSKEFSRNLRGSGDVMQTSMNRALIQIARIFIPILKANTPVSGRKRVRVAGKLRKSLRGGTAGQIVDVGTPNIRLEVRQGARTAGGAFYGHFVRGGTRAHVIRPVNKRALAFTWRGQPVVFARVNHPGTRANPYHMRALEQARPAINGILGKMGARIVRVLAQLR